MYTPSSTRWPSSTYLLQVVSNLVLNLLLPTQVAIINLVLAVGLAVDYSCHVAHSFVQMPATPGLSPRAQRQERTDRAVEEMGVAVVHGAVSTFLAVLILSTSKSYIFVIFFKQFFGICLFGDDICISYIATASSARLTLTLTLTLALALSST